MAAELALNRDPAATAARLEILAGRLRGWTPADPLDAAAACDELAGLERTVRLWDALAAALESTRPAVDAARKILSAERPAE